VASRVIRAAERLAAAPPPASETARDLLTRAVDSLGLSARGHARVGRVAATIAALAAADRIDPAHVAEALSYRSPSDLALAA